MFLASLKHATRALAIGTLCVLAWAAPASAQIAGKIQGRVTDAQTGEPIAGAQVSVLGTSLGALTDEAGRFFINNVPAGLRDIQVQFIGYRTVVVRDQRILAGQTADLSFQLEATAVELEPLEIVGEREPLVPRDLVQSRVYLTGEDVDRLPVDNLRQIISITPGAVESNDAKGLSIRGGRPGEAAVYVDNVLVRSFNLGRTDLEVGTNAIEEADLVSGGFSAEYGEAQSGVLNFVTRSGRREWNGSFAYQTDELAPNTQSLGFHRFEGSLGGPLGRGFDLFLAGTLDGAKSRSVRKEMEQFPFFTKIDAIDTVTATGEEIPCFVPWNEGAEGVAFSRLDDPAVGAAYQGRCGSGLERGNRFPFNAGDNYTANAKLGYSYGAGSRVSLSYLRSRSQSSPVEFEFMFHPDGRLINRQKSEALIFNWNQVVQQSAERSLAFQVSLSYQTDKVNSGSPSACFSESDLPANLIGRNARLTDCFAEDIRDPSLGLVLEDYEFLFDEKNFCVSDGSVVPAGQPVSPTDEGALCLEDHIDEIVDLILSGTQVTPGGINNEFFRELTPFPELNPYGTSQQVFPQAGFKEIGRGLGASFSWADEKRFSGRLNVDWQVDRTHRLKLGGEVIDIDAAVAQTALFRVSFQNFFHGEPLRAGLYAEDRMDLGDVVVFAGLRYDFFDPKATYPVLPGFTFTHKTGLAEARALCEQLGAEPAPFDANPADTLVNPRCKGEKKHAISPRVGVSFPVTENTVFRLSYGHFVQVPDLDELYTGINHDVSNTNTNDIFGRDLDLARTIAFEFGIRHLVAPDFVIDISAYNRDKKADVAGRIVQVIDPLLNKPANHNVLSNADFGNVRGVDVAVLKRFGTVVDIAVSYSGQVAKNTGSEPFTYFRTLARAPNNALGERVPPPEALLTTDDSRPHTIAGSLSLNVPADWKKGTALGAVFGDLGAFARFRFAAGLPYTRLQNVGDGNITSTDGGTNFGLIAIPIGRLNEFRLPWVKTFDLRLTKGFRVGGASLMGFADVRNLFNFTNTIRLFAETGTEFNERARAKFVEDELRALGNQDVEILTNTSVIENEVARVSLLRAEQRWGNGDGIFTVEEQERAFSGAWDVIGGRSLLLGAPRQIQLGFQLNL